MTPAWVALLDEKPDDADLTVPVVVDAGRRPGAWLALWRGSGSPRTSSARLAAARLDPRLVGEGGPAVRVSWVAAPGDGPIMDDPAVVHARREVLLGWPPLGMSTLARDPVHLAGSVTLHPAGARVREDPFARFGRRRELDVPSGVLVPLPSPTGPVTERYSGAPWPFDRFPG